MRNQCALYPKVNNESSKLYKDLLKKIKDRPRTNLMYAAYLLPGVAANMTNRGFKVNSQGQHDASAVMQFFNYNAMSNEVGTINDIAFKIGAKDSTGNLIEYDNAKDALQIAANANATTKGVVASVTRHNDKFNILTDVRDSRTQSRIFETEKKLAIWGVLESTFKQIGIDLNSFDAYKELINANEGTNFVQWLDNVKGTRNDILSQNQVKTLLLMDENSTQVQRLEQMFGNLNNAVSAIYDAFHGGRKNYKKSQIDLMNSALDNCKNLQGLDLNALKQNIAQIENTTASASESAQTQDILEDLNKKYGIEVNEIFRSRNAEITSLKDAAVEAIFTLQRKLKKLESEQGHTQQTKQLQNEINNLIRQVANKKYYFGVMSFLSDAVNQIKVIDNLFKQARQASGTNLEMDQTRARALMEIKNIMKGYQPIIDALSMVKKLKTEIDLDDADKQKIEDQANDIKKYFDNYNMELKEFGQAVMVGLVTDYAGVDAIDGRAIADIVTMMSQDSSIWDFCYSINRVSNPLISTMGKVIRDAQEERTKRLSEIALRIRKANNKLFASGTKNTGFMYEPDSNYIISDIDWVAYEKARENALKKFRNQGYVGGELREMMMQWQAANTEDRIVDYVNARTERVPNKNYRKAFPQLTSEQMEYYEEMMQIKGEIGTLLPSYAQKQYLPPQKRRTFTDAIAKSKGNPIVAARAILNWIKDKFIVREDDTMYANKGIINGEEYGIKSGTFDNTLYRQIPIFYINKIKDQGELLKDFSGALQALASTAINYECMNQIKDTVEFMGDYIKGLDIAPEEGEAVDTLIGKSINLYKQLRNKSKAANTINLIDGFIDKHIYGVHIKDKGKWTKLLQSLINYTSLKSLAVNVKGMISNVVMGELQMLIEAGAGEFYNAKDFTWAHAAVFGDVTLKAPSQVMDLFTNNVNSLPGLLEQRFDPLNDSFAELASKRYFNSPLRHMVSKDLSFIGYGLGERFLHFINMYAVLHNTKVKVDGKDTNLYDAFYKGDKENGNSELLLKNNVTYKDAEGNWLPVNDAFLDSIKDKIRYCNQTTHGSMNEEDKGLLHQWMIGRFVSNLRQWMYEHYSRRFRGRHWDTSIMQNREGYYNTVGKLFASWGKALFRFESEYATQWSEMTEDQKFNVKRAISEQVLIGCLLTLSFALGEPEDHKKEFWTRMWIYQTKRAILELEGSSWGITSEGIKLLNNPIPATNTVNTLMYPVVGLPDLDDKIKKGKYKGWNKYERNMLKYWTPFYDQIDQLQHMDEDESVFSIFDKTTLK